MLVLASAHEHVPVAEVTAEESHWQILFESAVVFVRHDAAHVNAPVIVWTYPTMHLQTN